VRACASNPRVPRDFQSEGRSVSSPRPSAEPAAGFIPERRAKRAARDVEESAMAHVITEPCIGTKDTACVEVCPVDCIHPTKKEGEYGAQQQLYIDPDTCIDCGLCVDECPVQAIFPQDDVPAEWRKYIQINIDYFKK
jgi:ferredoxin